MKETPRERTTIRLDAEDLKLLENLTKKFKTTQSEIIRRAIRELHKQYTTQS